MGCLAAICGWFSWRNVSVPRQGPAQAEADTEVPCSAPSGSAAAHSAGVISTSWAAVAAALGTVASVVQTTLAVRVRRAVGGPGKRQRVTDEEHNVSAVEGDAAFAAAFQRCKDEEKGERGCVGDEEKADRIRTELLRAEGVVCGKFVYGMRVVTTRDVKHAGRTVVTKGATGTVRSRQDGVRGVPVMFDCRRQHIDAVPPNALVAMREAALAAAHEERSATIQDSCETNEQTAVERERKPKGKVEGSKGATGSKKAPKNKESARSQRGPAVQHGTAGWATVEPKKTRRQSAPGPTSSHENLVQVVERWLEDRDFRDLWEAQMRQNGVARCNPRKLKPGALLIILTHLDSEHKLPEPLHTDWSSNSQSVADPSAADGATRPPVLAGRSTTSPTPPPCEIVQAAEIASSTGGADGGAPAALLPSPTTTAPTRCRTVS
eukprot:TRINITY_DN10355_c0_g1_i2.p1 TRINITY_DN10355_c0_g1~~TRINITY_DN10355_c0_g1_i2.p1  ORF type:complete len:436 (+),score=30.43 TRINITY_DN10355_c0_g1_i2:67-1374(+)